MHFEHLSILSSILLLWMCIDKILSNSPLLRDIESKHNRIAILLIILKNAAYFLYDGTEYKRLPLSVTILAVV